MCTDVYTGVACNLDSRLLHAAFPLLEADEVEAIEWSFDALFRQETVPQWFNEMLQAFAQAGRLIGHGIFFSIFTARWRSEQDEWLAQLRRRSCEMAFDHVSEHFGFLTGTDFHQGAPMSVPFTSATLAVGQDRLLRLQDACRCPVGLENLAFAFCIDDVCRHGDFLDQLLAPVNGFIILDLHNVYCQAMNFDVQADALLARYPLHRVREIHLSGGSWEPSLSAPARRVRRDTHDDAVPPAVFDLLAVAIPQCPHLRFVILEQVNAGLQTEPQKAQYRADFLHAKSLVQQYTPQSPQTTQRDPFIYTEKPLAHPPLEDAMLHEQQTTLARILETAPSAADARRQLLHSALSGSPWHVEQWPDHMLETAVRIAQKWK